MRPPSTLAIASVYLGAMLQGFALVSFPSSSAALRALHGLTDAQYGLIFLPQVGATIAGAVLASLLVAKLGLQRLLWIALLADGLSQAGLASINWLGNAAALPVLLLATGTMGLGFGLLGSPMNAYPPLFFPRRRDTAIVAVHSLNGAGLMLGPLLLQVLAGAFGWVAFPIALCALALVLAGPRGVRAFRR